MKKIFNPLVPPFDSVSEAGDFDHGGLLDLTADDHTQYALLAGRAGGQHLKGGTASGDDLTLESTNNATKGNVFLATDSQLELWNTDATFLGSRTFMLVNNAFTFDASGSVVRCLEFSATIISNDDFGLASTNLFRSSPTLRNLAGGGQLGSISSFSALPTINATTNAAAVGLVAGLTSRPVFGIVSGGVLTAANVRGVILGAGLTTGATITNLSQVLIEDATGTGTVTNQVGVDINDLTEGTTLNLSLRSAGAAVVMRHAGPAVFGANAAPTNSSVGLEVQSTSRAFLASRMTTTQRALLTPVDGMIIYNSTTNTFQGRANGAWITL